MEIFPNSTSILRTSASLVLIVSGPLFNNKNTDRAAPVTMSKKDSRMKKRNKNLKTFFDLPGMVLLDLNLTKSTLSSKLQRQ